MKILIDVYLKKNKKRVLNMGILNILVFLMSILVIISKFFDCLTTSIQITDIKYERNPIARRLMKKIGVQKAIWGVFLVGILIMALILYDLFNYHNNFYYKVLYLLMSLFLTITQFAIAYTNYTQKLNFITKKLLKLYSRFK